MGRMDGRTDGVILICHPKFLRGHKNERSFCTAKASHIFSIKNTGIFQFLTFEF